MSSLMSGRVLAAGLSRQNAKRVELAWNIFENNFCAIRCDSSVRKNSRNIERRISSATASTSRTLEVRMNTEGVKTLLKNACRKKSTCADDSNGANLELAEGGNSAVPSMPRNK